MSLYFADGDTLTFGVQSSNVAEVAQFSSTINDAFLHLYTNNYSDIDNFTTGVAIGTKSFAPNGPVTNDLYIGNIINGGTAVDRVLTMREDRIGIRTTTPSAILHVVGSNLPAASNILLVEAINSPPYPALVINKYGSIGIGTTPSTDQVLTVRGKLMVDNIQVGGSSGPGSSKLITAYGMVAPADASYLDFAYGTMSNISNLVTPLLQATNVTQTFTNIANYTLLNDTTTTVSAANTQGTVTFTTTFFGNAPKYVYSLSTSNVTTGVTTAFPGSPFTTVGHIDSRSATFASGSYIFSIQASASNGTGAGSYVVKINTGSFTIGATDLIGTPTVALSGSPALAFGNTTTFVSGVPYYTANVVVQFPTSSINFTNIYNNIDPTTRISHVLSIGSTGATTNYTYSDVFTNVIASSATNTKQIAYTITRTGSETQALSIPATVYNVNGSNVATSFIPSIAYLGTPINEATLQVATATLMPVTSVTRLSVASAAATPSQPSIATEISPFSNTSISINDAIYFPYTSTFYNSYATITAQRGTYAPSYTQVTGAHNILALRIQTTAQLYSFVLNFAGATGIQSVYVNWSSINNGANWYDANTYFTNANGCGAAPSTSTRFPIRLPLAAQTLTSPSDIYVTITFNGSIPLSGISVTNQ